MRIAGSSSLVLVSLLCFHFCLDSTGSFSLKNCTLCESEERHGNNVAVTCAKRDLTAIPHDIPKKATSLDVSENAIAQITRVELGGLSRLVFADFSVNLISAVEDGAFTDAVGLRFLALNFNKLTNLTEKMFQGLANLQELALSDNEISFIAPQAFQSLHSLRSVILNNNYLTEIKPLHPVLTLPTLIHLYLAFNIFESFQSDDIPVKESSLKFVDLSLNPLRKFRITRDAFPRLNEIVLDECKHNIEWDVTNKTFLQNVSVLSLSGTQVSLGTYTAMLRTIGSLEILHLNDMKPWLDQGLIEVACQNPSLKSLDISGNDLGTISDHLLKSCSQIKELQVNQNYLFQISDQSLRSLTQLKSLIMRINDFSQLPVTVQQVSTLEVLDLSFNRISQLECLDFRNLAQLTTLKLSNNHISTLQACHFDHLKNLRELHIGQNSFSVIGNAFREDLKRLELLNLNRNNLKSVSDGDFSSLSKLQELDLESEDCYRLEPHAFQGLANLRTLRVTSLYITNSYEKLESLQNLSIVLAFQSHRSDSPQGEDSPFLDLKNLKILQLTNKLDDIPKTSPQLFSGLASLESLSVDKFFKGLVHPDTFTFTPKLKYLQILHSDLSHLSPELFWSVPGLKELDLSYNKLQSLDFLAAAKLWALSVLKVTNNGLSVINETVFQSVPALRHLDLSDNPLTCECSNSGFIQWILTDNQTQVVNGYQYTCAFPVPLQGKRFLDFDIHSCWIDEGFLYFISSTCLIVLVLLTSFTSHFLRWHLTYAYYLFLAFLYDYSRRKAGTPHRYDAFISYNVQDEAWVCGELVPVLEGQQGWRLCLHHRDFQPGKAIVENITDAIYSSRKTICVISHHYLQSEWCSREIQMASFRLFDEHRDVLIMLFLEDIPAQQLSPYYRMRRLVKSCSYLSWTQAGPQHARVFWENVRRALRTDQDPVPDHQQLFG